MLTIKSVEALQPNDPVLWDRGTGGVAGFGARRKTGDAISYVLKYRVGGRQRWLTIGKHGSPWTPTTARARAKELLGEVARGKDPQAAKVAERSAGTVAELCEAYIREMQAGRLLTKRGTPKTPSTVSADVSRIRAHIIPFLGKMPVGAVTRGDVIALRDAIAEGKTAAKRGKTGPHAVSTVRGGKGQSTRTLAVLGAIFQWALEEKEMVPFNPCRGVKQHAYQTRSRRVSSEEFGRLGAALRELNGTYWPFALAMAQFLAVTGWRRGEAISLTWQEVDLATRTAQLRSTKTGKSMRPLSRAACDILRSLPRMSEKADALVFPSARTGEQRGFRSWRAIAKKAKLPSDISPHILRHSFASTAGDLGYSEGTIAALIGHSRHSTTSRYVHTADAVLLAAADAVADVILKEMGFMVEAKVVELRRA